jgi:hypothetical protein
LSLDPSETPVVTAVTFPKTAGRSDSNRWFAALASKSGWHKIESRKWDVYLPNVLTELSPGSSVLVFDDRVIGGNVQRMVTEWLSGHGHVARRAALVVHPDAAADVDWYEDVREDDFRFPWGGPRGRA